ncbi:MAG: response regulator [Proteobacteria bacterium]|uniref:ATP-binding protein n=1 Tax=Aquabacterium sp. TaxID=1872578 RepID=UPI0035C6EF2B|nr:response regulator [Pseudomonadota bacterium]
MPLSRRQLFSLRATVGYAVFAAAWIFLSDRVLERLFSNPQTLAYISTFKGLAFVATTTALLWVTLHNVPTEADVDLLEDPQRQHIPVRLAWGLALPAVAAIVQWAFWDQLHPFVWLLSYPAVFAAAWLGGWMAGIVATFLSATLVWYLFLGPQGPGLPTSAGATIATGVFVGMGLLLSMSLEWMHRAEQRSGNRKFEALVEQSLAGIYIIQGDRFVYVNPEFARMLGFDSPQDIVRGVRVADLVAPEHRERVRLQILGRLDNPGNEARYSFTALRRDGSPLDLEVHGRGLQTTRGNVVIGLALDVSEQRRNEQALRDKQRLLDRMSTLAKVGGWSIDVASGKGTRTDGAARILDLDPADPASLSFRDGLKYFEGEPHTRITQALLRAIEDGQPYALELPLTSAKGVTKWIRTQGAPVVQDGHVVRLEGAIQDISEVQQARAALQAHQEHLEQMVRERTAELEAARQEAERLTRIKSDFLANMSHEIRTPLNGVLGLAQIGLREHGGPAREVFQQISDSGRLLLGVINDILDFSKIEAGKLHIEMRPIELRTTIDRVIALVRERADAKGLALHVALAEDLPPRCMGDALRLEQILLNLLSNAVKFTPQGSVRVSASRRADRLVLAVSDTGIGMTPTQVARLFQPFEQADGSTTRQYGGTGLGLSIAKRLVEMLDGDIQVHSEPGEGTRFEVALPLLIAPAEAATQEAGAAAAVPHMPPGTAPGSAPATRLQRSARTPRPQRLAGLRILAAEDNAVNKLVLTELLAHEGAQVTLSDSGVDVVARLQADGRQTFDVVLMDIQMPLMDGYEATRQIRALAPDLPIIGQTAHAMAEEHQKCRAAGMVDLVVKPIELEALVATLLRHAPRA